MNSPAIFYGLPISMGCFGALVITRSSSHHRSWYKIYEKHAREKHVKSMHVWTWKFQKVLLRVNFSGSTHISPAYISCIFLYSLHPLPCAMLTYINEFHHDSGCYSPCSKKTYFTHCQRHRTQATQVDRGENSDGSSSESSSSSNWAFNRAFNRELLQTTSFIPGCVACSNL